MIQYILLLLLSIYLISKFCYTEYYENKISDYHIIVTNNNDSNNYDFYYNKNKIIESKECNLNKTLKSITKHNFNNNFDDIQITKSDKNKYTFNVLLDGKNKREYKVERNDLNKYVVYENDNELYNIFRSIIDNKETFTIRGIDFDKYATISENSDISKNSKKYTYKINNPNFNNQEVLAYSVFQLIQEINMDLLY